MHKLGAICLIVFASMLNYQVNAQDTGIVFEELQWGEVLSKAKSQQKLVFVEGYVEWSEPCALLDQYTLSDKEVGEFYNSNFVNVQVDMEDVLGLELAEVYAVESYPVFLFLDAEGNMVHRGCGALESSEFIQMGQIAKSDSSLSELQKRFESGESTTTFLLNYSFALENACMDKSGFVSEYFENTKEEDWLSESSWAMINFNVSDPFSPQIQYLLSHPQKFVDKYGKDTVEAKLHNVMLDQLIAIYEGADLTLFATQALKYLMADVEFKDKTELFHLADLKVNDLKENWPEYAENVISVVKEQEVDDPDQLNEFGWKFYLFINDTQQLEEAAGWMKGVIRDYPDATYYDTYASLKYKLGEMKDAVKYGELALQAAELEGEEIMHYKSQLKMFRLGK